MTSPSSGNVLRVEDGQTKKPATASPGRFRLLVGSDEFWRALSADIAQARERVWVQTLSFEGDTAGRSLAGALIGCAAPDRRILVDEFTRFVQNDRFLFSPKALRDPQLRAEVRETKLMMRELGLSGVAVRWGGALGFLARRVAWRNHKKVLVIDGGISYLGGINFTEHNFEWHDLMLRIDDEEVSASFALDFERSWRGERASEQRVFEGIELLHVDPPDLSPYDRVWSVISEAREELFVESAYITPPLSDALGEAGRRGVKVKIVSSEAANVPLFRRYITWAAERDLLELRFLPGMTHMKAVLADRQTLVMGSSNFHFMGHRTQNENVAVVTDAGLVGEFVRRVAEPDWNRSKPYSGSETRAGSVMQLGMKTYTHLVSLLGRGRLPPPRNVT